MASIPVSAVLADDSKEQVRQSVTALVNAPAYRMMGTFTDLHTKKVCIVTLECIRPDKMDLRYEQEGHITMETIAIGKKVYARQGTDGKFRAMPGDAAAMLVQMQSSSFQTFKAFTSVALVGHETLNGIPISIYKLAGSLERASSNTEIWISDKSHLPLKADAVGSVPDQQHGGRLVRQHVATTFTYGSQLKITPPK